VSTYVLGVSAFYHDSAACLLRDGRIIAAAQEERFTRMKGDARFPRHAVRYCLEEAGIPVSALECLVFYEKPLLKFERLLETYLAFAPSGLTSFLSAMRTWLGGKVWLKTILQRELGAATSTRPSRCPRVLWCEHHESHAASAFYPSPFKSAAILCVDGVGEWATTSAWVGDGATLTPLWDLRFPHSLGLLYSAFTAFTGFRVNSGEYKVMGLAPYGRPRYVQTIYEHLIDIKKDGTFRLNLDYFNYCTGRRMTSAKFEALFDGPPRKPEGQLTQREMDLARSIQDVTEEVMLRLSRGLHAETGAHNLCLAGGVALNCVGNGRILRDKRFRRMWIQPAAGDAGGAVGAALCAWHSLYDHGRSPDGASDAMEGSLLGPRYSNECIEAFLGRAAAPYQRLSDHALVQLVSAELASGKVVAWFQGRMEFGPRALGCRSILGDPRAPTMQSLINMKIKYRESFRPFAPSVLRERVSDYFDLPTDSPYMLLVAPVASGRRLRVAPDDEARWGIDRLKVPRSDIPAVTHVDYSARVQTVDGTTNERFYCLLKAFEARTGCAVLVNTSFNVRNEPIVCSPADAYRCFMRTGLDLLVLENCVLYKIAQTPRPDAGNWQHEFEPD